MDIVNQSNGPNEKEGKGIFYFLNVMVNYSIALVFLKS